MLLSSFDEEELTTRNVLCSFFQRAPEVSPFTVLPIGGPVIPSPADAKLAPEVLPVLARRIEALQNPFNGQLLNTKLCMECRATVRPSLMVARLALTTARSLAPWRSSTHYLFPFPYVQIPAVAPPVSLCATRQDDPKIVAFPLEQCLADYVKLEALQGVDCSSCRTKARPLPSTLRSLSRSAPADRAVRTRVAELQTRRHEGRVHFPRTAYAVHPPEAPRGEREGRAAQGADAGGVSGGARVRRLHVKRPRRT